MILNGVMRTCACCYKPLRTLNYPAKPSLGRMALTLIDTSDMLVKRPEDDE